MRTTMYLVFAAVSLVLFVGSSFVAADKEVRDRIGRLLYREYRSGDRVEVRGRNGTLLESKTRAGDKIYVRDRNGRLLRIERIR